MAVKAGEVIKDALEDIIVQSSESELVQSEGLAAIRALNDLMAAWAARGLELGYSVVSDVGDYLNVPFGAIRGIKANLALELAPKYNVPITAELVRKANDGFQACLNLAVQMSEGAFPPTLPMGSGNYSESTFYPDNESTILTETGGAIALEEDTDES